MDGWLLYQQAYRGAGGMTRHVISLDAIMRVGAVSYFFFSRSANGLLENFCCWGICSFRGGR